MISVYHDQMPDEDPASRLQPGSNVLVFLNPREAENGRGSDGYVAGQLYNASEETERQRLRRQLEEAEEELRRQFVEALGPGLSSSPSRP